MLEPLIAAFDFVFGPLLVLNPAYSLLIVSSILTVLVLGLNRLVMNKNLVKEIKARMDELKEKLTKAQKEGNTEEINKFLSEMMQANSQFMRQNFKTMIVSLAVIALFLPWLYARYGGMSVASLPFSLPVIGSTLGWSYWYVLVSFSVGWVIRKLIEGE